eukprot:m.161136 g.161136  ORF g.161136 m.161136 type:complete len:72 (-) comp31213_c0_seq1:79-294(-)
MATVSTFAGSGNNAMTNGVGTAASFDRPMGIAIDSEGTFLVADFINNCIRKITEGGRHLDIGSPNPSMTFS